MAVAAQSVTLAADEALVRSGANPGVVTRGVAGADVTARPKPRASKLPKAPAPTAGDKTAQNTKFPVRRIRITGNTVIEAAELQALARPYERRQVKLSELLVLVRKIQELYHARGYVLARAAIPPQDVVGGNVRVVVSEGRYRRLKIEGNKHYSDEFIERFFRPAMREGVVREGPIHRALLVLNEFPDLSVRSFFTAGKKPGTSDVTLKVTDATPIHVAFDYNNYGNSLVGQNRASLTLSAGSVIFEGDEVVARVTEPFPSESDPFYIASYVAPIGDQGDRIGLNYSNVATTVSGDLQVLDLRGDAEIFGITFQHPLERSLTDATNLTASAVSKSVKNFVFGTVPVSDDQLREVTLGFDANLLRDNRRILASALLTQGLGTFLDGSPNGQPLSSRAFAGNSFTKLNFDFYQVTTLAPRHFVNLRASGQIAPVALTTAELFALGGPDSVRGFIQSEFLGDIGYTASAEYRYALLDSVNARLQTVLFLDHGSASLKRPLPGERAEANFTGAGAGVRLGLGKNTSARVDVGFPLNPDRNVQGDTSVLYGQFGTRF